MYQLVYHGIRLAYHSVHFTARATFHLSVKVIHHIWLRPVPPVVPKPPLLVAPHPLTPGLIRSSGSAAVPVVVVNSANNGVVETIAIGAAAGIAANLASEGIKEGMKEFVKSDAAKELGKNIHDKLEGGVKKIEEPFIGMYQSSL